MQTPRPNSLPLPVSRVRWVNVMLVGSSFCFTVRFLAMKLLGAMLYHPFRYADDPSHSKEVANWRKRFESFSYQLDEIEYTVPSSSWIYLKFGGRVDAMKQRAFLIHPTQAPAGLWMVHGGNAMVATDWFEFCAACISVLPPQAGKPAFLLIDYPGYGANPGTPSPASVLVTQLAALPAALFHLQAPPKKLHILGHSLGAAAAAQLASVLPGKLSTAAHLSDLEPGRLVLSAPFLNIDSMAQAIFGPRLLPSWMLWLLLPQRWNNAAWVPNAAGAGWEVGIIFGEHDEIVPTWMGQALKDAVQAKGQQCRLVIVRRAGHNNLLGVAGAEYAVLMGLAPSEGTQASAAL